jgi:hypothetical protein
MIAKLMNPSVLWSLGAAVPAVLAEYLYRTWPASTPWWHGLWMWAPLQLSIGYCIFRLVTAPSSGSLLDAFVMWAFATTFLRVLISTMILHETVKGGTWFALGLLTMARVAQTFWGR